jgi:hypothetical protein
MQSIASRDASQNLPILETWLAPVWWTQWLKVAAIFAIVDDQLSRSVKFRDNRRLMKINATHG